MQDRAHKLSEIPARYAAVTGAQPLFVAQGTGGLFAVKWKLPPHRVLNLWAPHHALSYHVSGIATIIRSREGTAQRKVPAIGSVTFSPGDCPTEWLTDAPIEAMQLYISVDALQSFAEQHLPGGVFPAVHEFFGIRDPWLAGYFKLLEIECALGGADPLFLDQTEHLMLRHLARQHGESGAVVRRAPGVHVAPLSRGVTQRVEDYIEANIGADISLRELAALSHVSVDHFVRAFRAATGKTPHRYLLERRLEHAAQMLTARRASIADTARASGFRSAAHFSVKFHTHFGVTPTEYRRSA